MTAFAVSWVSWEDRYLDIHVFSGYLIMGLLAFRLVWGLSGGPYARFRDFMFGWKRVRAYLVALRAGHPENFTGHNPAGSWAVLLMLTLLALVVVSGLLTLGGEERHGPFAGLLGFPAGDVAHRLHASLAWVILGLVGVHLLGVAVASWLHRENLVAAMLTGYKRAPGGTTAAKPARLPGVLLLLVATAFAVVWFQGAWRQTAENPYLPFVGPVLPDDPLWREECGDCHLAYHPSLLPARSWRLLMQGQGSHFEEDLSLAAGAARKIQDFLEANGAEHAATEAAWKIDRSIPASESPLRITATSYWVAKHDHIAAAVWLSPPVNGRGNCSACHLDAVRGTFEDAAMGLPKLVSAN